MGPLEVQIDSNRVVSFDGRVLEIFGASVRRYHVTLLAVTVSGPDKRGTRTVKLEQSQVEYDWPVDEAQFEQLRPVLDALRGAGVSVSV
jgi:hypothetical protein